jgi:hypothetical protein
MTMEAIRSSETPVITRATPSYIAEGAILYFFNYLYMGLE